MANEDMKKRAEALGLSVDKRWSDETLAEKVAQAEQEAAKAQEEQARQVAGRLDDDEGRMEAEAVPTIPLVEVELIRDRWDDNGNRIRKGKRINLPVRDAMRAIREGKARDIDDELEEA